MDAELQKEFADLRQLVNDTFKQLTIANDMLRRSQERVIIMVDRSNLDQTWRRLDLGEMRPDYIKLQEVLLDGRTCQQARLYYSEIDESKLVNDVDRSNWKRHQDFYTFLRYQGWVLRKASRKIHEGISVEKGLDAALIKDMESICREGRCHTVILVAGDADYCEVVQDAQVRYSIKVEVAFFPNQTSRELSSKAKFIDLECLKDRFVRKPL